jgi:hypothetical protein
MRRKWKEKFCEKEMTITHQEKFPTWHNKWRIHTLPLPNHTLRWISALPSVEV